MQIAKVLKSPYSLPRLKPGVWLEVESASYDNEGNATSYNLIDPLANVSWPFDADEVQVLNVAPVS